MAFEEREIHILRPTVGTGVKASLFKSKEQSVLKITIKQFVGDELGWKDGDKLLVLFGTGDDFGMIRLQRGKEAGTAEVCAKSTQKGTWFSINLGSFPELPNERQSGLWCQWEKLNDDEVEIVLPSWCGKFAANTPQAALVEKEKKRPFRPSLDIKGRTPIRGG